MSDIAWQIAVLYGAGAIVFFLVTATMFEKNAVKWRDKPIRGGWLLAPLGFGLLWPVTLYKMITRP